MHEITLYKPDQRVAPIEPLDLNFILHLLILYSRETLPDGEIIWKEVETIKRNMRQSTQNMGDFLYQIIKRNSKIIGMLGLNTNPDLRLREMLGESRDSKCCQLVNPYFYPAYATNDKEHYIAESLDWAKSLGFSHLIIVSGPRHQHDSWPLWHRMFGKPTGTLPRFYGNNEALVWILSLG